MKKASGFTLIELLIVVAIIAILAAIAVPNFLEAQVRAKVSRSISDMRTLNTAIEAYSIDHNLYPPNTRSRGGGLDTLNGNALSGTLWTDISSPVAYITNSFMFDVFNAQNAGSMTDEALFTYQNLRDHYCGGNDRPYNYGSGSYNIGPGTWCNDALDFYGPWRLGSVGPDMEYFNNGNSPQIPYDTTNGSISIGNIWRSQKRPENVFPSPDQYPSIGT